MTDSFCNATVQCFMQVPFTGSGITVIGLQLMGGIDFTASLDGVTLQQIQIDYQLVGSPVRYNVTLFDTQSLDFAAHTLVIASSAGFQFDYAYVTQINPSPSTSTSSRTSTSASSSASSSTSSIPASRSLSRSYSGGCCWWDSGYHCCCRCAPVLP